MVKDAYEPFLNAARWIPRSIDPFLKLSLCFRVGFFEDIKGIANENGRAGDGGDDSDLEEVTADAAVEAL